MSFNVVAPSCFTTFSAWVNSRFFTGEPALQHIFQRRKKLFGAFHAVGGAVELDPAFARRGLDAEFGFQRLQIARLVVEQLLREPRVFKMKSFSGHN